MTETRSKHERVPPQKASILAEGDSWFDLPLKSDIVQQLRQSQDVDITTLAHYGNTLQKMAGSVSSTALAQALRNREYDLLLFSGGGSDILSDGSLRTFLRPRRANAASADLLDTTMLEKRLVQLERLYENLLENVTRTSRNPAIKVITHTYDFVWPRNAPYCVPASLLAGLPMPLPRPVNGNVPVTGPWLDPILRQKGITDDREKHEIVKRMLIAFKDTLERVAARSSGRLVVVDTQGTLGPDHWSDEIHPDAAGAQLLASKIYALGIQPQSRVGA